eukprot:514077-Pyramimonas_sp.AAC.1
MADVTADYHQRATADGAVVTIPEAPPQFQQSDCTKIASSTSFVDDVKAAALTSNGNKIHQLVSTMWGHLIRSTFSRGLPISTAKSSYIVYPNTLSGKRTARTMTQEKLSIADIGFTVTITRSTKLLGAMFSDRNDLGQEIAVRTIALRQTTGPLRKTLFQRRAAPTKAKIHYLEAL